MAARMACGDRGRFRRCALAAAVAVAGIVASPGAGAAEQLNVVLDQALIVKLPERVSTIVVGNPSIADISVQAGGIMIVTGKGYGATNILALDRSGRTLMEKAVQVHSPRDNIVVVYRGVDRDSYSCTPRCERRFMLGDAAPYFEQAASQIGVRTSMGQIGAPPLKN